MVLVDLVDDAMPVVDQLTNRPLVPFGHDAALLRQPRERRQALFEPLDPVQRTLRTVLPDEIDDVGGPA